MRKIKTSDLKEGMKFDKPVYIDGNNLLVPPNIPIKQKDIERLIRWEILEVETEGEVIEEKKIDLNIPFEEFSESMTGRERDSFVIYLNFVERIEDIFDDIAKQDKGLRQAVHTKIDDLVKDILDEMNQQDHDLIQYILLGSKNEVKLSTSSLNCALLSGVIGQNCKLIHFRLLQLVTGAMLHDIGMVRVPDEIVNKKEKLVKDEYNTLRMHTIHSYKIILQELSYPEDVAAIALYHHEKWDGTGYPKQLKGDQIPLAARIVAVTDAYEAMVNERPYRSALIGYNAMKNMLSDNGTHFDPGILKVFLKCIGIYPIGSYVLLNDSHIGKVIEVNSMAPMRPKVQILYEKSGEKLLNKETIDLMDNGDLFIIRAIDPKEIGEDAEQA
ncbi:MAG: HD-GYP domain-containing protein [Spirochaetales bacterium]|nr:HD-GYP domain-containing protein [Spirochaetales bacterium]